MELPNVFEYVIRYNLIDVILLKMIITKTWYPICVEVRMPCMPESFLGLCISLLIKLMNRCAEGTKLVYPKNFNFCPRGGLV